MKIMPGLATCRRIDCDSVILITILGHLGGHYSFLHVILFVIRLVIPTITVSLKFDVDIKVIDFAKWGRRINTELHGHMSLLSILMDMVINNFFMMILLHVFSVIQVSDSVDEGRGA